MAIFLIGVTVVGMVGAMSGLVRAETAAKEKELASRLAEDKLDELIATEAWQTDTGGDFTDEPFTDYSWELEEVPTGTEGLTGLRVTVTSTKHRGATSETIVFEPTATAAPATGGGT